MSEVFDKLPIDEFTEANIKGDGVFDVLMRSVKAHLQEEWDKNRIKGTEYANVYLGSIERTMAISLEFFVQARKAKLEEQLLSKQIELADKEIELADKKLSMADCEQELCKAQVAKTKAETVLIAAQADKIPFEIELAKQESLLAAEKVSVAKAELEIARENLKRMPVELEGIKAQTELVKQNTVLAKMQEDTVRKEQCKLDGEFDLIMANVTKAGAENALLAQKTATERAQVSGQGVDPDSVIGKQKSLYTAQTEGFKNDAMATLTKAIMDTWNVRRTTDEGTEANADNKLYDPSIGNALTQWANQVGISL